MPVACYEDDMSGFISIDIEMPCEEQEVEVLRDFGHEIHNIHHPAYGCRYAIERTKYMSNGIFMSDIFCSGNVTHWRAVGD